MRCIFCDTDTVKVLQCVDCKKYMCKKCLKKWHIDHYKGQLLDPFGPRCKCTKFGYSDAYQDWFVTSIDKELQWEGFLEKEKLWLIKKMQQNYGWDKKFIRRALYEYKKFIDLKAELDDTQDELLAPSTIIDKIWCEHLTTQDKYIDFCLRINKKVMYRKELSFDDNSIANYNEKYYRTLGLLNDESLNQKDIWIYDGHVCRPNCSITIRTITKRLIDINTNLEEDILTFRCRIKIKEKISMDEIQLMFENVKLENKKSLSYYGIKENSKVDFYMTF